jgi:uncharacterized Tic20 family protein
MSESQSDTPPPAGPQYQNNFTPPAAPQFPPTQGGVDPRYPGPQGPGQPGPQGPGQPGPQTPGQPMRPDDERTWSLVAHIGTIVLGFIAPLIVLLVKGNESPTVRANSVESLNFQITVTIGYIASSFLMIILIGFITLPIIWIVAVVLAIMATVAVSKGEPYKYPFALRLVK